MSNELILDSLRRRFRALFSLYEDATATMTLEQVNHREKDLVMPIANGYEVCSQIRRISSLKEIPVIIVTSNDGIADRVRARLVGASGFLGKPIDPDKFPDQIIAILQGKSIWDLGYQT